jgi:putative transposase
MTCWPRGLHMARRVGSQLVYDVEQYKLREKVERFFNKMKHFRRIATRYEKLRQTFLAFMQVVALWIMIR